MKRKSTITFVCMLAIVVQVYCQERETFPGTRINTPVNENIPVYRIELRLLTSGGAYDGTDNEVYAQLDRNDSKYFLDYGRDDFNRNADQRFDLVSEHIRSIKDIDFIKLGVKNNDQWGIKRVELYLNNSAQPVFSKTYATPVILNNKPGERDQLLITSAELRSNIKWQQIPQNSGLTALPVPVKFDMIKAIVESVVGNQLHQQGSSDLQWGSTDDVNTVWGAWVEGGYLNSNTLHFDLDLEYAVPNSPDVEVDVDFNLVFDCTPEGIVIKTTDVKINCELLGVDCEKILKVINPILQMLGKSAIEINPGQYTNSFMQTFTIGSQGHQCRSINVLPNGDVLIF